METKTFDVPTLVSVTSAKLHMDRCRHDMERIVRLEQQLETRETELADLEQEAARLRSELDRYRNALALLRPGIELDLRYDAASAPVLCADCPPPDYPTDETRCAPCPRRESLQNVPQIGPGRIPQT